MADRRLRVGELSTDDEAEVLNFLNRRPTHTFGLNGFIRANGLVNPQNRGTYYACRDVEGRLQGVALIGHHILFETINDAAIGEFAKLAQACPRAYVLLAEREKAELFWQAYAHGGKAMRVLCREWLMEQRWPVAVSETIPDLRPARLEELELLAPAHAQIAFQESGVNPLETDRAGFLARYSRRIAKGQTWVWIDQGKLIFKADIVCDTAEVIYLEGVWVNQEVRQQGYGHRCLTQLTRHLLHRSKAICLLVNENYTATQNFYGKAGFKMIAHYDTIFMQEK
ncbi:MAG: GNAT family N-acetyltransferase [Acidobacteria bacterium]|nr:GNAT family N-acetyltransferase [Acidobacteriota bacterium]